MNRMSKRLMVLAMACAVFVAGFGASAVLATYTGGDYGAHKYPAGITNTECMSCHGQKALERSLDPQSTMMAHRRHLYSAFMRFMMIDDGCVTCHQETELFEGSGAALRRQVDTAFCVSCHGIFRESTVGLHTENFAETEPRRCTRCHTGAPTGATHAGVDYVNQYYTRSRAFCTKCHGGLVFYPVEEIVWSKKDFY